MDRAAWQRLSRPPLVIVSGARAPCVDTTDGYAPGLDEIIEFVRSGGTRQPG